jgi:hypothetical protein
VVGDLAKGYALAEFYPLTHPTLAQALHKLEADLLTLGMDLRCDVGRGGFATGTEPLARRSPHAARFAARLAEQGVSSLVLRREMGAESLGRFLSAATLPPRVVRAAGGFHAVLTAAGARGVVVNGSVVDPPVAAEEPLAEEKDDVILWSTADMYDQVRESATRVEHEDAEELRQMLHAGSDSERLEALERLEYVGRWAVEQGMVDRVIALVEDLRRDAEHLGAKSPAVRGHVMLAIHRLANRRPVIDELVARLGRARTEEERASLRATVLYLGAEVVQPLEHALTAASDLSARRAYRDALVALDHVGVPLLEDMVGDERWFVVRNMVGILGEIRSADALDHFTRTIRHSDPRVRRETILALSKLGGEEAVPLLVRGLSDAESGLRAAAALGLGLTKSGAGVTPILAVLGRETDNEACQEMIRALGRIGDPRAVPALAERAGGGWLSRTPTQIRVEAVRALGEIGGEAARAVLQRLAKDRDHDVREAVGKAFG